MCEVCLSLAVCGVDKTVIFIDQESPQFLGAKSHSNAMATIGIVIWLILHLNNSPSEEFSLPEKVCAVGNSLYLMASLGVGISLGIGLYISFSIGLCQTLYQA